MFGNMGNSSFSFLNSFSSGRNKNTVKNLANQFAPTNNKFSMPKLDFTNFPPIVFPPIQIPPILNVKPTPPPPPPPIEVILLNTELDPDPARGGLDCAGAAVPPPPIVIE